EARTTRSGRAACPLRGRRAGLHGMGRGGEIRAVAARAAAGETRSSAAAAAQPHAVLDQSRLRNTRAAAQPARASSRRAAVYVVRALRDLASGVQRRRRRPLRAL